MNKKQARERVRSSCCAQVEIPHPGQGGRPLHLRVLGRHAPARDDRHGAGLQPALLIADEPTTALDVTTQAEILDLIKRLQQSHGMAVMFITHDMGVVAEIADEVLVMYHGKVVETGPVDDIFHAPQHAYTRMLIGSVVKLERKADIRLRRAPLAVHAAADLGRARSRRCISRRQVEVARGRWRVAARAARRDARHRRRIGLGQDDDGPLPAARLSTPRQAPSTTAAPTARSSIWRRPTRRR